LTDCSKCCGVKVKGSYPYVGLRESKFPVWLAW
jgi:hypothetical protein